MIPEFVNFMFVDFETTGIEVNDFDSDTYPIEIGCIFTDHNLMIKDTYEEFIKWEYFNNLNHWPSNNMKEAYNIHKIEIQDIIKNGRHPSTVVHEIVRKITSNFGLNTVTIVSDNAYFETYCMHKLFNHSDYFFGDYFHYTSWDINLLLKTVGVERLEDHSHRAFDDAASMYHQTLRALQKLDYFKEG